MKATAAILILFLFAGIFSSCEKVEGQGGTSTIAGKVWVEDWMNNFTFLRAEYWGEEEDVYLIYGNDTIYSDRTKTNYDGSYWFQYLHEGTYTVYVYSDDSSNVDRAPSGRLPIIQTVTISSSGSTVTVPTITILD